MTSSDDYARRLARKPLVSSEDEHQEAVARLALLSGWRVMHVRRTVRSRRGAWTKATSIAGWPDLTLWRPGRVLFVECLPDVGELTAQQSDTLDSLAAAGQDVRIWRPSDWDEIVDTLTDRAARENDTAVPTSGPRRNNLTSDQTATTRRANG